MEGIAVIIGLCVFLIPLIYVIREIAEGISRKRQLDNPYVNTKSKAYLEAEFRRIAARNKNWAEALEYMNKCYCLQISQDEILEMSRHEEPLISLAQKITTGKPTVMFYMFSMHNMLVDLMAEMQLDETSQSSIVSDFLASISCVTDEVIDKIAKSFAANLSEKLYFLKEKINYELAALGFIMQYGVDSGKTYICDKVNGIRRKRETYVSILRSSLS